MFRRLTGIIALLLMTISVSAASAQSLPVRTRYPAPDPSLPPLTLENPLFWHSDNALDITATPPFDFGIGCGEADPAHPHPCWAYRLTVADQADELRVGIDLNRRGQCFDIQAWAPGTYDDPRVDRPWAKSAWGSCQEYTGYVPRITPPEVWNAELRIAKPETGDWVVRVVPLNVDDWGFRLRAALLSNEAPTMGLPNIRALPPYEFGFAAPSHADPGKAWEYENGGSDPSRSCIADDVEDGRPLPTRCLRFSTAIYNVGEGDLELRYVGSKDNDAGPVIQYIRSPDGLEQHPAGQWEFHEAHGHRHFQGVAGFDLFRVVGPGVGHHELEPVSTDGKWGWGAADQRMADWQRIDQGKQFRSWFNCLADAGGDSCAGQTAGWGDHYRWQRPGNFVTFPVNSDGSNVNGDYVVRVTMDVGGNLLESNEDDNVAYAWIRVEGNNVSICERGYGQSPWDPHNQVLPPGFWVNKPGGTTTESPTVDCTQPPYGPRPGVSQR